jgi:hypothetical protein
MTGFNLYQDQILAEIYREERLREAEMERLARLAIAKKPKQSNCIRWGMHLQKHYGTAIQLSGDAKKATG